MHSSSTMDDDGDDKDDTKRRTRNLSEKKRRDQFNVLVNELSNLISTNGRKMDKSTVLKSTISFLKNHNEVTVRARAHDVQEDWKPSFLHNDEFTYLVLEALEGFVIVFCGTGKIYYVSDSITSLLGHNPADIVNKSIFDLAPEEDKANLYGLLQNPGSSANPIPSQVKANEIRFQCHLRRGTLDFRDDAPYELVQFSGHFRTNMEQFESDDLSIYRQGLDSRLLFICTGRLYTPQLIRDVSLVDSNRNEFTSRHSLEWKFLFLDHRAPPIIGYLPFEVLGTSGYDYYHFDDLEAVATCHEALMLKGELTSCYYRFLTKGQQWIWLQTRYFITYHQWNSKPEFVVCIHRVVNYSELYKATKQEGEEVEPVANEVEMPLEAVKEQPAEEPPPVPSPSYISTEGGEAFGNSYLPMSQAGSLKSVSMCSTSATAGTAASSWSRAQHSRYSDTASLSSDSRSSQQNCIRVLPPENCMRELNSIASYGEAFGPCDASMTMYPQTPKCNEPTLVPQHGIGAQYLDPSYVGAVSLPGVLPGVMPGVVPGVMPGVMQGVMPGVMPPGMQLPLPHVPVVVAPDQAQMEQMKHEQLEQMIVQQQEELRHVREQLLLARLGMLPLVNQVPNHSSYVVPEEAPLNPLQPAQRGVYEGAAPRPHHAYPSQSPHHHHPTHNHPTHNHPTHNHPTHNHPTHNHPHMPQ